LVYVIGETARANNFSLYGYNKTTNPLLQKENVVVFKDVNSCGTSTAISLPCMFSSQTQQDFKQNQADYTQNLVDIIQSAGYDIFWKDNDDGCKNVCKRIPTEDTIKTNKQPYCLGSYCYDEVLLDGLEQEISAIKKDTVIVLHTMGSHGPSYHKRYPASFEKFVPVCHTADLSQCSREEIVNAYDNTILYTDYILSEIIRILKQYSQLSSSMLYVSDHGESLGENNIYLHGFPYVLAPDEQKKVPMILWLSEQIKKDLDIDIRKLNKKAEDEKFSHDNLFHSILYFLSTNTTAAEKERTQLNVLNNQQ
jgi:lipid A ethanolaminephosphotransferase